jgi:hypothetical protein
MWKSGAAIHRPQTKDEKKQEERKAKAEETPRTPDPSRMGFCTYRSMGGALLARVAFSE